MTTDMDSSSFNRLSPLRTSTTTLGLDFKLKTIQVGQKAVKLQVWDMPGHAATCLNTSGHATSCLDTTEIDQRAPVTFALDYIFFLFSFFFLSFLLSILPSFHPSFLPSFLPFLPSFLPFRQRPEGADDLCFHTGGNFSIFSFSFSTFCASATASRPKFQERGP